MRVCTHPKSKDKLCDKRHCKRFTSEEEYAKEFDTCGFWKTMSIRAYREMFKRTVDSDNLRRDE